MRESFYRWLGIRLIMRVLRKTPDYTHNTALPGSVPYYMEWNLLQVFGLTVSLTHLLSTSYRPLGGVKLLLIGWYGAVINEKPLHIVLREAGDWSFKSERPDISENRSVWMLRFWVSRREAP